MNLQSPVLNDFLYEVAEAIRIKKGYLEYHPLSPADFVEQIMDIDTDAATIETSSITVWTNKSGYTVAQGLGSIYKNNNISFGECEASPSNDTIDSIVTNSIFFLNLSPFQNEEINYIGIYNEYDESIIMYELEDYLIIKVGPGHTDIQIHYHLESN